MWVTKMAYKFINAISDVDLPENSGDFKLLSRRAVDELLRLNEHDPYMRGLSQWVGFKHDTILYKREARFAGKTHFSLFGTGPTKEFIRGITSFSAVPLYLSLILGMLVSFGAVVYLLIIFITKFRGLNIPGWSAIMATMLFLGGTILFTNGVMGMYIARIHYEVKKRPQYIIRDKVNLED
jgi:dolichol-phosphate mannosyltransferase